MRATLKEVAELAKVSIATASMALNRGEVKESTRTRVLECAKRLNYVPNRIGRTLNTGKSNTIALLMMTSVQYNEHRSQDVAILLFAAGRFGSGLPSQLQFAA